MPTSSFSTAFVRLPIAGYAAISNLDWSTLAAQIRRPEFLEALYIASPSLYDEAIKLNITGEPDEKTKRVLYALIKYLSRYATRCTPFGLFGGFATLPIGSGPTTVQTQTSDSLKKVVRLDMNFLCALAQNLEKHPGVKPYLRFTPNTSLYSVNGQYRYVNYAYNEAGMRVHDLTSADQNEYLDAILTRARYGASPAELADVITSDEVSVEEAQAFVDQVVDTQLLVSELEPALTGDDFLVQIIQTLEGVCAQHATYSLRFIVTLLTDVKADLKQMEQASDVTSTEQYEAIAGKLSQLDVPFDRKALFQIDTFLPNTTGQLNKGLINKLVAKMPILMKLSPSGDPTLAEFQNKFYEKYEEEEVPLVIALDPEIGIGYPAGQAKADVSPLVDGVWPGATTDGGKAFTVPKEHTYLLQKVAEAQLSGAYEITISEDDLRHIEPSQTQLPMTNTALFSVIRETGGEKVLINSFGGATGTYLLGRFGHTDPSVLQLLREISQAEAEAADSVILADVVHLPEARTGNIIIRPQLNAYQIPYLGKASVDQDHEIRVTDLMLSVRGNQLRLRSKSLNKYVIPRLANAHNYAHPDSLDIYHFLCALQNQQIRYSMSAFTGSFSNLFLFTPRIVLDNLILSEAQWSLKQEHLKSLVAAFKANNWSVLKAAIDQWRAQYRIPRFICVADGDNDLYVDLDNQLLAETFVQEIKSREKVTIIEFLHNADNAVVRSPENWHTNQFVVAFRNVPDSANTPVVRKPVPVASQTVQPARARKFFTGSEWLYYKVYTGVKMADWLLADVLLPLTDRLKANGWIDKFFFIRYADPNGHFRIRFHVNDPQFIGEVVRELHEALAPYVENRTVTAVLNDTYNRELERYGRHSIEAVEDYFHIDSEIILRFLSLIEGIEGEECRWRFGMKLTDDLLTLFGFDLKHRLDLAERQATYFGKEFGYNPSQKKQLDGRYKEIEPAITELLAQTNEEHRFFYELAQQRTDRLQLVAQYIQTLREQDLLVMPLEDLLTSLIHMSTNRLFRSRQRFVEYSIYYHLHKYYRAVYGRTVLAKKQQPALTEAA
ncbi:Subtilin biosynthesis protein spaB [Fibrisoma limi BUZ 3]|uniref:Subtilin biosynthesis protein spaB n=1 Tax=Fibrisoma limi BUZ 3 TaxID=1185876 RepID=I2GB82_9BACT|nr:lantibiotic dehydratase [Fibrisoma limi]CCH51156.1 Subtilin biosynthesis protein spaB [Fibrisoma limi BUZ 3]